MNKLLAITLCLFLISYDAFAQDPVLSQYNISRLYTNPAFAGANGDLTISTAFRNQWGTNDNLEGYRTSFFSADKYLKALRGGLGIMFLHDNGAGALKTTQVDLVYSPHFELFNRKLVLKPAFGVGYRKRSLDLSKLTFGDPIDPRRAYPYVMPSGLKDRVESLNITTGLLVYSDNYFAGFAIDHINQPEESFTDGDYRLPLRTTFHAGANFGFGSDSIPKFVISPNILAARQSDFEFFLPGVNLRYKFGTLGLAYWNKDAFMAAIGFQNRFLKISYSYEHIFSTLPLGNLDSHEIQLAGIIRSKKQSCTIKRLKLL